MRITIELIFFSRENDVVLRIEPSEPEIRSTVRRRASIRIDPETATTTVVNFIAILTGNHHAEVLRGRCPPHAINNGIFGQGRRRPSVQDPVHQALSPSMYQMISPLAPSCAQTNPLSGFDLAP